MSSVLNDATAAAVQSLHASIASLPPSDHRDALATGLDAVLSCVEDHIAAYRQRLVAWQVVHRILADNEFALGCGAIKEGDGLDE